MGKDMRQPQAGDAAQSQQAETNTSLPPGVNPVLPIGAATSPTRNLDPPPSITPGPGADTALQRELSELRQMVTEMNRASQAREMDLRLQIDRLQARAAGAPFMPGVPGMPGQPTLAQQASIDAQARLKQLLDSQASVAQTSLDELRSGRRQFQVSLSGESRMNERVGAEDELHAWAKFCKYFGIRAIIDAEKRYSVTEVVAPDPITIPAHAA